jgi:hypothetical protein
MAPRNFRDCERCGVPMPVQYKVAVCQACREEEHAAARGKPVDAKHVNRVRAALRRQAEEERARATDSIGGWAKALIAALVVLYMRHEHEEAKERNQACKYDLTKYRPKPKYF